MLDYTAQRLLIDSLEEQICVIDQEGIIIDVNRTWTDFGTENGTSPEFAWIGCNYLEILIADDTSESTPARLGLIEVLNGSYASFHFEYPCHSLTTKRWFMMHITSLKDDPRHLFVITHYNITPLKLANEALAESEDRLKFALLGSGDGMWDWDVGNGEVNYSIQWKAMLGYTDDEIKGDFKEWEKRVHPDDLATAMADLQDYLSGATPHYTNEHRLLCKDGSYKWILTRGIIRTRSPDGSPLRMIGTHTDVSGHRHTEEALRIAAAAFETQDGIIVADADKVILRVNLAFTRITGYSGEDVIGQKSAHFHSGRHNEVGFKVRWASVMADGRWEGEVLEMRKNGEFFPMWLTITAIYGLNKSITHYLSSFRDISLLKLAEKVLFDAHLLLENHMVTSQSDLMKSRVETTESNTAFTVLLKHIEANKTDAKNALSGEFKSTILPFLKMLKAGNSNRQQARLLELLETNFQQLMLSYGSADNLAAAYHQLTRSETQVASMGRGCLPR
jgi:PAS domain S-box-containing protein